MISPTEDFLVTYFKKQDADINGDKPWPSIAVVSYWLPDGTPLTRLISLEQLALQLDQRGAIES